MKTTVIPRFVKVPLSKQMDNLALERYDVGRRVQVLLDSRQAWPKCPTFADDYDDIHMEDPEYVAKRAWEEGFRTALGEARWGAW